jgi:predicted negative regulator of RcsB-dependent stress response
MAPNKKISRSRKRELEAPDEFLTFTGKVLKFVAENRIKIISGASVFLALLVIGAGLRYYSFYVEKKASEMLDKGSAKAESLRKEGDLKKAYESGGKDFRAILEKYPNQKAGKIARIMLADLAFEAGEYDAAVSLYKEALQDFKQDPFYGNLILTNLAYASEQKKDYESAMTYLKMIDAGAGSDLNDQVLFDLGRIQSKINPSAKENEYYRKIAEAHPNSPYADMAREKTGSGL